MIYMYINSLVLHQWDHICYHHYFIVLKSIYHIRVHVGKDKETSFTFICKTDHLQNQMKIIGIRNECLTYPNTIDM